MLSRSNGNWIANFSNRILHDAFRPPFGTLATDRFRPAGVGADPDDLRSSVGQEEEGRASSRVERQFGRRGGQREPQGPSDDAKPAAQANDTEKPHTILDTSQEAPKTDSLGHVHFASPNGEGLGRVMVKAPATDKVKVFLEGRLFGTAPVTIYSVPKGDYIVEAQYPNGKEVSKPVTVSENEETAVDLGGAKTAKAEGGGDNGSVFSGGEMTSGRKNLMYGFLAGAVVGIAVGTTFGILDIQAENDYKKTPPGNQAQLDSIQQRGQRDAEHRGRRLGGDGRRPGRRRHLRAAADPGREREGAAAPSGTPQAFMLLPVASPAMTGGAFSMRF